MMKLLETTFAFVIVLFLAAPLMAQPAEGGAAPADEGAAAAAPTADEAALADEAAPADEGAVDEAVTETADEDTAEKSAPAGPAKNVIGVGLKAGVALPQLTSELDTNFDTRLELTYLMPFWGSRFGIYTAGGYTMPTASGEGEDDRLPEGTYTWEMTQRQIVWDFGLTLRVMEYSSPWNVNFLAGSRMTFVSTLTNGKSGGMDFGEHDEQGTWYGAFASVMGEYRLGPGSLFLEVNYGLKLQDLKTTGELAVSEINVLLGYRMDFVL